MTTFVMYAAAIISVAIVIFMLIKKMDIKITLFLMGIVLMFVGCTLGNPLGGEDFVSTGSVFLDPLKVIADQFKSTISSAGFIILILGGYSAYMSAINANSVTVNVLTKPIAKIKSVYILVPIVFLLGNLLSLVIPSASNLAVILLATLYPILIKAGMNSLTAAGIIATTATIVPTPLGSDNVAIAAELANTTEFAGLGFVLPLILVALTALIVLLSGSGTALFFAMVPLMVPLAAAAGISALAVSIPMGLAGNLLRAVSPVSAVVMIVAGSVKREPLEVVKRTSVPMIAGTVVMFVLSMVIFL